MKTADANKTMRYTRVEGEEAWKQAVREAFPGMTDDEFVRTGSHQIDFTPEGDDMPSASFFTQLEYGLIIVDLNGELK